jgi:hypothetical protein
MPGTPQGSRQDVEREAVPRDVEAAAGSLKEKRDDHDHGRNR